MARYLPPGGIPHVSIERRFPAAIVLATALGATSFGALAVDLPRVDFQGASGMCKAATPGFAGVIRYRPLGLSNESTASAFVTCNWQGDDSQESVRGAKRVWIVVSNDGSADISVACTLVNGFRQGSNLQATYTPKIATIAAGQSATIQWLPAELPGAPARIGLPSVSCALPGAASLNYTGKEYDENVGA